MAGFCRWDAPFSRYSYKVVERVRFCAFPRRGYFRSFLLHAPADFQGLSNGAGISKTAQSLPSYETKVDSARLAQKSRVTRVAPSSLQTAIKQLTRAINVSKISGAARAVVCAARTARCKGRCSCTIVWYGSNIRRIELLFFHEHGGVAAAPRRQRDTPLGELLMNPAVTQVTVHRDN